MDEVLVILTFLTEALIVLQCIQVVYRRNIKVDKYVAGIILFHVVVYTLINQEVIPVICSIIVYIIICLFCYYKFKLNIIQTIIRVFVCVALVGCVEGMSAFILHIFSNESSIKNLFFSSIMALIAISVLKRCIFLKVRKKRRDGWQFAVIIFYGLMFVMLVADYYYNSGAINIYLLFASTFLIFIFYYRLNLEQAHLEIEKRNYEIELQKIYGDAYENLLEDIRRKQHDYKNQLGAILGMHLTAQSLDELINMQKKYSNNLHSNNRFDSILTGCNNPILAGFLYYRCASCENEGVVVDYSIHIDRVECRFALHEIIEILGILIDNACENVLVDESLEQCIRLEIQETTEKILISVSNPARYISFSEIDKMFIKGYSSKGQNRGIGLARVLDLIKKYEAEVRVSNYTLRNEENWISFIIEIDK